MDDFPAQAKNVTKTFSMNTGPACAKYQVRMMTKNLMRKNTMIAGKPLMA